MNREMYQWEKEVYSDEEINQIATWFEDLTIAQLSFIKDSYTEMLQARALDVGQLYVH